MSNSAHLIVGTVDGRIVFRLPFLNFGLGFLGGQPPFEHSILCLKMKPIREGWMPNEIKINAPPMPPSSMSIAEFVLVDSFF
jgi:hypothetical protein